MSTRLLGAIRRTDHRALLFALLLGTVGGGVFDALDLPLPWMLGAMLFTSIAAVAGARVAVPTGLRSTMVMILGVMLGSTFDPSILAKVGQWIVSLTGLAMYIVVCVGLGIVYLRRATRCDLATAFFAASPGGFNEMIMIGGAMGGDERSIAMSHSGRVMLVVFTMPVLFQFFDGLDPTVRGAVTVIAADNTPRDWVLLAGCVVGAPIAGRLKMPAAVLVGPMVLSAALHLIGLTDARPPQTLVAAAQVIVGSAVGARFAGIALRDIVRGAVVSVGLTVVLLSTTIGFALLMNRLTGIGLRDLILAYSPGGLAEMSLVALALGGDAAFVSTHHVVRIILIVLFAPALFALIRRWTGRSGTPEP